MDVKSAFLQGNKISCEIFVYTPPEAQVPKGRLWKLRNAVYGLNVASRNWFCGVREELFVLNCQQSSIDKALFRFYDGSKLVGLLLLHLDDFLYAGEQSFRDQVIKRVFSKF